MPKLLKWLLIGLVSLLVLLLAAALVLPSLFKDDILDAVDAAIAENLNAQVYYNRDNTGLSLFKHFPNATLYIGDAGVVGQGAFAGDTLAALRYFDVEIDLFSLLGSTYQINRVTLEAPQIYLKVLQDGTANYLDILKASEAEAAAAAETEGSASYSASVQGWAITEGNLRYEDAAMGLDLTIAGLNHSGSGDFTQDVFDLITQTQTQYIDCTFGGVHYLNQKPFSADITTQIAMGEDIRITLKDNLIKLSEVALSAEGTVGLMGAGPVELALDFASNDNSFKSLLSLVPAAYMKDFDKVEAAGSLAFSGAVTGAYDAQTAQMPGFKVDLMVEDGMFKYPDVPQAVRNVALELHVDAADGQYDALRADMKRLKADFGSNPISGKAVVQLLPESAYQVDGQLDAKLALDQVKQFVPMQGLDLKGVYDLHLKANGVYSDARKTIPKLEGIMTLANGYIAYDSLPVPIEQINLKAEVANTTGELNDTRLVLEKAGWVVEGEPFQASGRLTNLEDPTYALKLNGALDLALVNKLAPMGATQLAGKINANITTEGRQSFITNQQYTKLATSGNVLVTEFAYQDPELLPQGIRITSANLGFTPKAIALRSYVGYLGQSDINLTGQVTNYLPAILDFVEGKGEAGEVLKGSLGMRSNRFDTNEWMSEAEAETPTTEEEEPLAGTLPIPKFLDLTLQASIGEVLYTNMTLKDLQGKVEIEKGVLNLENVSFQTLGGRIAMNGAYDTSEPEEPTFDFGLDISQLSFQDSYSTLNSIQALAPFAQNIQGDFASDLKISGKLGKDMMPDLSTLAGSGLLDIADAQIKDMSILNKLSQQTGMKELQDPKMKNVKIPFSIKDGKVVTEPFEMKIGDIGATVQGSNGLDGSINFNVDALVPGKYVSSFVGGGQSGLVGQLGGFLQNQTIPIPLTIGGSYANPTVGIGKPDMSGAKQDEDTKKNAVEEGLKQLLPFGKKKKKDGGD